MHHLCFIIISISISINIRYGCLLSQAFSSWYISRTSGDPHPSGFKLHPAVLSVLCVMFQVYLSFVVSLSDIFVVQVPNFSLPSRYYSSDSNYYWYNLNFRFHIRSTSLYKLSYFKFFSASFCTTFLSASIATYTSVHVFDSLFFYYIWPIACSFSVCVYCLVPQHRLCVCVCVCVYHFSVGSMLCMLSIANVYILYQVLLNSFSSPKWGIPKVKWSIVSSCCLHKRHLLSVSSFKILFLNL